MNLWLFFSAGSYSKGCSMTATARNKWILSTAWLQQHGTNGYSLQHDCNSTEQMDTLYSMTATAQNKCILSTADRLRDRPTNRKTERERERQTRDADVTVWFNDATVGAHTVALGCRSLDLEEDSARRRIGQFQVTRHDIRERTYHSAAHIWMDLSQHSTFVNGPITAPHICEWTYHSAAHLSTDLSQHSTFVNGLTTAQYICERTYRSAAHSWTDQSQRSTFVNEPITVQHICESSGRSRPS